MNTLFLIPLFFLAWRDFLNRGEVEDYYAIPSLMMFIFFADLSNLALFPLLAVGLYIMHKFGAKELDLWALGGIFFCAGLWAFVVLLLAIELVMLGFLKKELAVRQGVAFLPYMFLGGVVLVVGFLLL